MGRRCRAPRQLFQQPCPERVEFAQSIHVELDGFRPIDFSRYALGESLQAVDVYSGPGSARTQLQPIADRRGGLQKGGSPNPYLSSLGNTLVPPPLSPGVQ